jgi:hypothetical protein
VSSFVLFVAVMAAPVVVALVLRVAWRRRLRRRWLATEARHTPGAVRGHKIAHVVVAGDRGDLDAAEDEVHRAPRGERPWVVVHHPERTGTVVLLLDSFVEVGAPRGALDRAIGGNPALDFCPEDLREEIDEVNALVYDSINNGVYKAGFATSQAAYEDAFDRVFAGLDAMESRLEGREFLVGNRMTEADWRLFTTLLRFDPVYHTHFKCNLRRIRDYPNLSGLVHRLQAVPGVDETIDMHHIKHHYYVSHDRLNPSGIVPKGPETLP